MEINDTELTNATQDITAKLAMKRAGTFFFLLMLIEIPVSVVIVLVQGKFSGDYTTLISILMTQGYLLIAALLYIVITKTRFGRDLQMKKYKISTFFLSLVVLMTAAPMASFLNIFSQLFVKNQMSGAVFQITKNVPIWAGILIIGCLPGFIEELVYRGILYHAFRKRSVLTAIIVSSLSFGLMHMNFNQILYAIYLGIIFALILEATGSLFSTMILHMLFNAVNTSYVYILPKLYEWLGQLSAEYADVNIEQTLNQTPEAAQLVPMMLLLIPFAIGGLVLTILLVKAIANINGRTLTWKSVSRKTEENPHSKSVYIFLLIGWIFCIIIATMNMLG